MESPSPAAAAAAPAAPAATPAAATVPHLVREVLGVRFFSDDTVLRGESPWPDIPADPSFQNGTVGSRDLVIDDRTRLSARVFLPKSALENDEKKLPLVIFFHGGGFVTFRPSSFGCHSLCSYMASNLDVVVVSVDYRLAPEHRLPVAFEDALQALKWLQDEANCAAEETTSKNSNLDPWLRYADFSRCLLMGESAGGAIVHNMGLKVANECDLSPLQIRGLVMSAPFFGAVERSDSEMRALPDALTLDMSDSFWFLSLPEGAGRDHAYSRCPTAEELAAVQMPPCLVVQGANDILYSRNLEYAEALREAAKDVELLVYKDKGHLLSFPEGDDELMLQFMAKCFG